MEPSVSNPLQTLKLVFKFKVLTLALHGRKRLCSWLTRGPERDKLMVNIGGGYFFRPNWKVLDYSSPFYPFARRFIDFDVDLCSAAQFPLGDDSVSFFYSAHTLEHIPQEHCPHLLEEVFRCLKPGGAVRINVPDYELMHGAAARRDKAFFTWILGKKLSLEQAVVEQIATERIDHEDPNEISENFRSMGIAEFADHYTSRASRDVQRQKGGYHINWFSEEKLGTMLRHAGFSDVYRSRPQESRFEELAGLGGLLATGDVLEVSRMIGMDATHPEISLYMEAVK